MLYSVARLIRQMRRRKETGLGLLVAVLAASIVGNAVTFYFFDGAVNSDITVGDAIWYSLISVTTIGYGDFSAVTIGARIGTIVFIVLTGLAAFTSAIGIGVDFILDQQFKERTGMGKPAVKDHLVIVNFPNERRVQQIVTEYLHDPNHRDDDVIVISDNIESLPFRIENVSFVRGLAIDVDTYDRANISDARLAIVLSTGYDDPNSDSVVASIASVIGQLNPKLSIIAEVLNSNHALLFNAIDNVSLVHTFSIANNLIVQEAQDPGVNQLTQAITSNSIEGDLSSTVIDTDLKKPMPYIDAAKQLLDNDVNLVGIIRNGSALVRFNGLEMSRGDRLVYISAERLDWPGLSTLLE